MREGLGQRFKKILHALKCALGPSEAPFSCLVTIFVLIAVSESRTYRALADSIYEAKQQADLNSTIQRNGLLRLRCDSDDEPASLDLI